MLGGWSRRYTRSQRCATLAAKRLDTLLGMIPTEVAADPTLRARFLTEVAYSDGLTRSPAEETWGRDVLASDRGGAVVAWLWPDRTYSPDFDPFDVSDERNVKDSQSYRKMLSDEFLNVVVTAQAEADRTRESVLDHVRWTARLGFLELSRLQEGSSHVELMWLVLEALQVEFGKEGWVLRDPDRLGRRIDQSERASQIAEHLRFLTIKKLDTLREKLPQGTDVPVEPGVPVSHPAPPIGSRYRTLYEALAADVRTDPFYEIADGALILQDGTFALPEEAATSTDWWKANETNSPQAAAWLAAGFRAGAPFRTDAHGLTGIGFRSLPGREEWLAEPNRLVLGTYRLPELVPIRRVVRTRSNLTVAKAPGGAHKAKPEPDLPEVKRAVPEDIEVLVNFLVAEGEASRKEIDQHLRQEMGELKSTEITNLLTRARRRRRAVNRGTDTRPRWVAVESKGDCMIQIAEALGFDPVPHVGRGQELPGWFARTAWEVVDEIGQQLDPIVVNDDPRATRAYAALGRVAEALRGVDAQSDSGDLRRLADLRDAADEFAQRIKPFRSTWIGRLHAAQRQIPPTLT